MVRLLPAFWLAMAWSLISQIPSLRCVLLLQWSKTDTWTELNQTLSNKTREQGNAPKVDTMLVDLSMVVESLVEGGS
eukprot:symbB.v1.2.019843.t1/scaffold1644.1/size164340/13